MAVEKVSLSLDPELVAEARQLSGRGGLSGLMNEALRARLQHLRMARLLDDMDAEFGSVPDELARKVATEWRELGRPTG
ncbi:MAG: hypothetical protein ACT4O0_10730 [Pseudonocardia sp.]